ncbi:MAG: thioredoxin reductase (NADPH) [Alphaproteobacteria bacterium]|jgi:thioredoxin reductase (NADPH)
MKKIDVDIAVIGAGPVGLFTVFEAGMAGYSCAVIDSLDETGGQLTALYPEKPIYDIPGHAHILAEDLIKNLEAQAAPFKPQYVMGDPVSTLTKHDDGHFTLIAGETTINAKSICLAAGGGMFAPRKPPLENIEYFEKTSVFYSVRGKNTYKDQNIVIAGGGDSAADWAVELAPIAQHIHVIHRRAEFRAAEETVKQLHNLNANGNVTIHTPCQLKALQGDNAQISSVTIADLDGIEKTIEADKLLCFFGIAPSLGPIVNWDLNMSKKTVDVDPTTMASNIDGICAVGDIAGYGHKLHLILTGFAESALAIKTLQHYMEPDKKFKVQFSTSKGVPTLPSE